MKTIVQFIKESKSPMEKYIFDYLKKTKTSFGDMIKNPDKLESKKFYGFTSQYLNYNQLNKNAVLQYLFVIDQANWRSKYGYFCISVFEDDLFELVFIEDKDFKNHDTLSYINVYSPFGSGNKFNDYEFKRNARKILNKLYELNNDEDPRDIITSFLD